MSSISSFDFIAAVAPALRQAIDQGTADPHRWRMVDHKLIDSKSGKRWYEEDKSDEVIENEEIEKWSKQIECRQLTTVETLHEVLDTYKSRWQKTGFESIESLNINNIHDSGEDYHTLWACSQMKDFIHENNMQLNQNPNSYESGLLIICGMGSPRAMSRLITITKPKIIMRPPPTEPALTRRLIESNKCIVYGNVDFATLFIEIFVIFVSKLHFEYTSTIDFCFV